MSIVIRSIGPWSGHIKWLGSNLRYVKRWLLGHEGTDPELRISVEEYADDQVYDGVYGNRIPRIPDTITYYRKLAGKRRFMRGV